MGYTIMPRSTVESIVEQRNQTLELYAAAYESLAAARDATVRAGKALMTVSRERSSFTHHSEDARRHFLMPLDLPERDAYLATARRLTDSTHNSSRVRPRGVDGPHGPQGHDLFV